MWVEKNTVVEELKKDIKLDGMLTQWEKQAMREALRKDRNAVINATKEELKSFIVQDYAQRSYELVGKEGVKKFQKTLKIKATWEYDINTFKALVDYQTQKGILVDGILGNQTFSQLWWNEAPEKTIDTPSGNPENMTQKEKIDYVRGRLWLIPNGGKVTTKLVEKIKIFEKVYGIPVTGEVTDGLILALKDAKKLPYHTPMIESEIKEKNRDIKKAEKVKWIEKLQWRWKNIYNEFYLTLWKQWKQEVSRGKPFSLVDSRSNKLLFVDNGKQIEMWVILWENGTTTWKYTALDKKTPIWKIHDFNIVKYGSKVPKSWLAKGQPYYPDLLPADNSQWRNLKFNKKDGHYHGEILTEKWVWKNKRVTVVWLSIQSNLSTNYGWRYFHLVWPWRNKTWGCVWIKYEYREQAKQMAKIIQKKWGFGYVSKI